LHAAIGAADATALPLAAAELINNPMQTAAIPAATAAPIKTAATVTADELPATAAPEELEP